MTAIRDRSEAGLPIAQAIREGMAEKMRAVIMTGFVPAIGFVPMALAHGTGAEVQKPLATVVIGGLIAPTILPLLVDRKAVVWGKSVSVRVALGGGGIFTKKIARHSKYCATCYTSTYNHSK